MFSPQPQRRAGMLLLVWKGADSPHSGTEHLGYKDNEEQMEEWCWSPEVEHILGHVVHGGPVLGAGDACTLEPVLLLQPLQPVLPVAVEEDGAVVLADLVPLPDVLDGLHHHMVLHVVTDDTGVARVVKQGQSGVNS